MVCRRECQSHSQQFALQSWSISSYFQQITELFHSFFQGRQWVCKNRSGWDLLWSCRYKGCRRMLGVLVLVCSSMIHTCFFEKVPAATFDLFGFPRSGIRFLPNHAGNLSHSMPLAMSCVPRQRIRQGSPCCWIKETSDWQCFWFQMLQLMDSKFLLCQADVHFMWV
jgi:hypothetical protein